MKARRARKPEPVEQPAPVAVSEPIQVQVPAEPPAPAAKQEGYYPFRLIARWEAPDGREIRKMEAKEYGFGTEVVIKTSTRFLDAEGHVTACSEALCVVRGTIKQMQAGRW